MKTTLTLLSALALMALSSHTCRRDEEPRPHQCHRPADSTLVGTYTGTSTTYAQPSVSVIAITASLQNSSFSVSPVAGESFEMKNHGGSFSVRGQTAGFDIGYTTQDWSTAAALSGNYNIAHSGDTLILVRDMGCFGIGNTYKLWPANSTTTTDL